MSSSVVSVKKIASRGESDPSSSLSSSESDATLSACSSVESLPALLLDGGGGEMGTAESPVVVVASDDASSAAAVNQSIFRLQRCSTGLGLSPMSEIALNLKDTSLDTPKSGRVGAGGGGGGAGRERSLGKAISSDFKSLLEAGEAHSESQEPLLPNDGGGGGSDGDDADADENQNDNSDEDNSGANNDEAGDETDQR
nr:uncharacterized protein LOC115259565 isoform X1 [Aedes albopictus]